MSVDPSSSHSPTAGESRPASNAARVLLLLLALAGVAIAIPLLTRDRDAGRGNVPGRDAPPIEAAGWLNGPAPTAESFKDKVVFLHVWASW